MDMTVVRQALLILLAAISPIPMAQAAILCVAAHLISVHGIAAALLQLRENLAAWMS